MAGARVAVVFTNLQETAKHVGGQTIKFNKSILRIIEAKLRRRRRSLEPTPDVAPEENLRPENLPPEGETNDMSSSKPSSQNNVVTDTTKLAT